MTHRRTPYNSQLPIIGDQEPTISKQSTELETLNIQPVLWKAIIPLDFLGCRIGTNTPGTHSVVFVKKDDPLFGKETERDFDLLL